MTSNELLGIILADSNRIKTAIETGAAWEIWMQVELAVLLRGVNMQVTREVPYPPPNNNQRLDTLAQDVAGCYAIELKVESATTGGNAGTMLKSIQNDIFKVNGYEVDVGVPTDNNLLAKWVVVIFYSAWARNALENAFGPFAAACKGGEANDVFVLIVNAPDVLQIKAAAPS